LRTIRLSFLFKLLLPLFELFLYLILLSPNSYNFLQYDQNLHNYKNSSLNIYPWHISLAILQTLSIGSGLLQLHLFFQFPLLVQALLVSVAKYPIFLARPKAKGNCYLCAPTIFVAIFCLSAETSVFLLLFNLFSSLLLFL